MKTLIPFILCVSCGQDISSSPHDIWTLNYGPFTLGPGLEKSTCYTLEGPKENLWFNGYDSQWSKGMHHFGVYANTTESRTKEPYPCNTPTGEFVLMLQTTETSQFNTNPEIATQIAAGPISVNVHTINTTDKPIDIAGKIDFYLSPEPSPEFLAGPIKANWPPMTEPLLVPAQSTTTVVTECTMGLDVSIIRVWGHQHAHGKRFDAFIDSQRFYESTDWENPPIVTPENLRFNSGSKLRLECEVMNNTSRALPIGPSAIQTAEMCALMGTWIPFTGDYFPCR